MANGFSSVLEGSSAKELSNQGLYILPHVNLTANTRGGAPGGPKHRARTATDGGPRLGARRTAETASRFASLTCKRAQGLLFFGLLEGKKKKKTPPQQRTENPALALSADYLT